MLPAVTRLPMSMWRWTIVPSNGALTSLNRRQRGQTIDIGLLQHDLRARRVEFGDRFGAARLLGFALLIGHDALGRFPPALVGGLGEIGLGLLDRDLGDGWRSAWPSRPASSASSSGVSIAASVWPACHMIADIDKPFGDIAVHPGIDRGLVPRRGLAGKRQGLSPGTRELTVITSTRRRLRRVLASSHRPVGLRPRVFWRCTKKKPSAQPDRDHDGDAQDPSARFRRETAAPPVTSSGFGSFRIEVFG